MGQQLTEAEWKLMEATCPACAGFGQGADPDGTQLDPVPPLSCDRCHGAGLTHPELSEECPGTRWQLCEHGLANLGEAPASWQAYKCIQRTPKSHAERLEAMIDMLPDGAFFHSIGLWDVVTTKPPVVIIKNANLCEALALAILAQEAAK